MKLSLFVLLIALISITSCESPIKPILDKTEAMKKTTDSLDQKTGDMLTQTALLYRQSRTPYALGINEIAKDKLVLSNSMDSKLYYSVMYVSSLEFTLWTSISDVGDTRETLYDLYYEGLLNVTTFMSELSKNARLNINDIRTISPATTNTNKQSLLALAYAIGETSREQRYLSRTYGFKALSFLDLSTKFLKDTAINNTNHTSSSEYINRYEIEFTQSDNKRMILNLINLRMNIFTGMVLAKVSTLDKQYSKVSLGILSTINKAKHLLRPWTATFGQEDESMSSKNSKIRLMNKWLSEAIKAKNLLKSIGEKPILDKLLVKIMSKMKFQRLRGLNIHSFENKVKQLKEM